MFAKKPAPPPKAPAPQTPAQPPARPAGWALRILTPDFVVTGYMAPIEMPLVGWLNVPTQTALSLSQAQLRALDPHAPGAGEPLAEVTVPKASIIAVLPHDEMSLRSALQQLPPTAERALICAWPYWLHGSFRLTGNTPLRNLFSATAGDMLPVSDVEIRAGRADVDLQVEHVAAAVVNKRWVQVYYAG